MRDFTQTLWDVLYAVDGRWVYARRIPWGMVREIADMPGVEVEHVRPAPAR